MKRQKSFQNEEGAALYLVPTPIGNLQEVSPRVLQTLQSADVIACEDTRNSGILLKNLNISKPLIAHHEYNQQTSIPGIVALLRQGKKVAVISDAGYPLVSDPGAGLVRAVIAEEIPVISMSGPNAGLNALVASGLDASHYLFYGFLDSKSSRRVKQLEELKDFPYTLIFYEAPHRIESMLADLKKVFGDRQICLARELTKLYEEYLRGTVSEVQEAAVGLKGEMVVVVEGCPKESSMSMDEVMQLAHFYINEGMKTKAAAAKASQQTGVSKNEIYQRLIQKNDQEEQEA